MEQIPCPCDGNGSHPIENVMSLCSGNRTGLSHIPPNTARLLPAPRAKTNIGPVDEATSEDYTHLIKHSASCTGANLFAVCTSHLPFYRRTGRSDSSMATPPPSWNISRIGVRAPFYDWGSPMVRNPDKWRTSGDVSRILKKINARATKSLSLLAQNILENSYESQAVSRWDGLGSNGFQCTRGSIYCSRHPPYASPRH